MSEKSQEEQGLIHGLSQEKQNLHFESYGQYQHQTLSYQDKAKGFTADSEFQGASYDYGKKSSF